MTSEFVPALRQMEIYIVDVHHILWGEYPMRQTEFVAETLEAIRDALTSDEFIELETKLKQYADNYTRKVISYKEGFQI